MRSWFGANGSVRTSLDREFIVPPSSGWQRRPARLKLSETRPKVRRVEKAVNRPVGPGPTSGGTRRSSDVVASVGWTGRHRRQKACDRMPSSRSAAEAEADRPEETPPTYEGVVGGLRLPDPPERTWL